MNYLPRVVNAGLLVAINSNFWYPPPEIKVEAIGSESLRKTLSTLIFLGGGGSVDTSEIVTGQVAGVSRFSRENGQPTAFLVDAIVFVLHPSIKRVLLFNHILQMLANFPIIIAVSKESHFLVNSCWYG